MMVCLFGFVCGIYGFGFELWVAVLRGVDIILKIVVFGGFALKLLFW